jgi:hypothetical protein
MRKMATIKKFKGEFPPELKIGELATDGDVILMKNERGQIRRFINHVRVKVLIEQEVSRQLNELQG